MSHIITLIIGFFIGLFIGWANRPAEKMSLVPPTPVVKKEEKSLVKDEKSNTSKEADTKTPEQANEDSSKS